MSPGRGLALAAALLLLLALTTAPVVARRTGTPDDHGDGLAAVRIPKPVKTPRGRPRTWLFLVATVALTWTSLAWTGAHSPESLYAGAVSGLAQGVTGSPSRVAGYTIKLHLAGQFVGVCFLGLLALTLRATPARRVAVLLHAVLYLGMSAMAQALTIVIGLATGLPVGPFGAEALVINALVGGLVMLRMTFTTFVLPRPSSLARSRPRFAWDTTLTLASLLFGLAAVAGLFAWIARRAADGTLSQTLVPIYAAPLVVILSFGFLFLMHQLGDRPPAPTSTRPAVDVITPAWNEEAGIHLTLDSLDRAAAAYGGPVHVIVSNDGSTDATERIVGERFAAFGAASGHLLTNPNAGKAVALNRALAETSAEIVIRVDADVVVDERAILNTVPWFADPAVGSVGALMMPRQDGTSWFHRMRGLECLFQFGMARRAQQIVDGLTVVPGTYVAFRRDAAVAFGGFVDGMNGEDSDLTLQLGRVGYRSVLDDRVRAFEDVPPTPGEFLEQRTRWSRAGMHVFARHNPMQAGLAGPRIWWWLLRRGFAWGTIVAGLIAPVYLVLLALLQPTARRTVGVFVAVYLIAGLAYLLVTSVLVVRHRQWRLLPWMPTWYGFTFLRRLAMLEALISLPTRPVPLIDVPGAARPPRPARSRRPARSPSVARRVVPHGH